MGFTRQHLKYMNTAPTTRIIRRPPPKPTPRPSAKGKSMLVIAGAAAEILPLVRDVLVDEGVGDTADGVLVYDGVCDGVPAAITFDPVTLS